MKKKNPLEKARIAQKGMKKNRLLVARKNWENSSGKSGQPASGAEKESGSSKNNDSNKSNSDASQRATKDEELAAKKNSELNNAPKNKAADSQRKGEGFHLGVSLGGKIALGPGIGAQIDLELTKNSITAKVSGFVGVGVQLQAKGNTAPASVLKDTFAPNSVKDVFSGVYVGKDEVKKEGVSFSTSKTADIGIGITGTYDLNNLNHSGLPNELGFGSVGGGVWWGGSIGVTHEFGE